MKKDRNAFLAGLFILISAGLIVTVIVGIKGLGALTLPHNNYYATFTLKDNISGLRVGDDVRVGGVKLGTVRDVQLVPASADRLPAIRVHFMLPKYVGLTETARMVIESTVTGTANLNIEDIRPSEPLLADGGELKGNPSGFASLFTSLGEVAQQVSPLIGDIRSSTVPKVNTAVDEYKGLAVDVRAKIEPAYGKYAAVADRGDQALTQVRDVLGESKGDFKGAVANLNASTATVKEKIGPILEKLDGGLTKAQTSLDKVNLTLDEVKSVSENSRDITSNIRGILANNRGRIENIIATVKGTSDNLKGATSEIRRAPWRLIYKPAGVDQANQGLFDSARQFAEGANDLDDAATALRDALTNPQVNSQQVQQLIDELETSFSKFNKVEQRLWQQVKE